MIYIRLILTMIFWGGTFLAAKFVSTHTTPFIAAFIRFVVASLGFILILGKNGIGKITRSHLRSHGIFLFLLGMTGIFSYNFFFFKGLSIIEAGRASVIVAMNPVFINILAVILFGEEFNLVKLAGVLLSVSGAILVITRGEVSALWQDGIGKGEWYILGSMSSWVIYSLLGKKVMKALTPLQTSAYSVFIGTMALAVPAAIDLMNGYSIPVGVMDWLSLVYLGIFGTVLGFLWFYEGIQVIGAGKASIFINLVPINAMFMSAVIFHEEIPLIIVAGTLLVLSGVILTNRSHIIVGLIHQYFRADADIIRRQN